MEGGNAAGLFEIDGASGELFYTGGGEDYETGSTSFELTIRASDGDETTDTTVAVNVTDVDEPVVVDPPVAQPDQSTPQTVSEPAGEDFSAGTSTSGRVAVGDTATGRIGSNGDRDWFAVELVAGRTYVIDLRGSPTDDGTLSDPYLRGIHDSDGNLIPRTTNDDGGQGYNSRVTFTATESGTHYIAAGAAGVFSGRGTYEVEVTDTSPPIVAPDPDSEDPPDTQEEVQQQPPAFGSQFYGFDLPENTDGSADRISLGTVSATDPDGGSVTYSIEGGNAAGLFEIDAASGELFYTGSGDDFETGSTRFELTVRASDGDETTDSTATVSVTDLPAHSNTTGTVVVGGSATGNIGRRGDGDWFAVELAEGSTYIIDLRGSDTDDGTLRDPYLGGIHDANGNLIPGTSNNNGGEGWNSRVTFKATESGTHFIAVGVTSYPFGETHTGTYTLAVTKITDDLSADTDTTGTVAVGGTATGEIEFSGDRDWFAVTLEAGKTYRFDLEGAWTDKGTLYSPYLRGLYDAAGAPIYDTTDYGGVYRNAQFYFTATTSGTYYVAADALGDSTGSYMLAVTQITDDFSADTGTTGTVAVGGTATGEIESPDDLDWFAVTLETATGEIESPDDRDWFAVTLEAGKTYRFDLHGAWGEKGTLGDPYLWGLYDATGALIDGTTDNNGGGGNDSQLNFTVATSGIYYVAVGANDDTGSYTLSVTDITEDVAADTDTTATVAVGGAVTEDIETIGDRDWFAVTLEAGKTYRFDLEGSWTDKGTLTNLYLWGLYDATGTRVDGTTTGGGIGYNSHRYFTAAASETYYVAAGATLGPWFGSYTLAVTELAADVAADTTTTATVTVGGTVIGDIETLGDRDWFAVTLEAGKTYRLDLEGTPTHKGTLEQPYLRGVYDSTGVLIDGTTDDNSGWVNNSRVYFTATTSGTYYVAASSAHDNYAPGHSHGGAAGTYTLSVTELAADVAADTTTTATVAVGGTATGEIESLDDRDWFAMTLEAGKTYRVDLEGLWPGWGAPSKGTLTHPHLRGIHDAAGVLIDGTTDENSGRYNSSQVYFTAATSGIYYVAASEHYGERTGTYALTVTELVDDFFANTSTTGTVAVGGTAMGDIEFSGDSDWFAVTLEAGKTYRFDLEGESTDKGTLGDPYLRGIHDANGALIDGTTDDDGGDRLNSRVEFTAAASGTYYAAAGASGNLTGSYTLAVEEVVDGI